MSVTLLQGLILALIVFAFAWDARWECFFVFHPIIVCRIAYAVDRYRVSVIVLRI